MTSTILTWRPWYRRALDAFAAAWRRSRDERALHELDPRTLADIGIDRSEIPSIEAEATARVPLTRMRIVWDASHG